VDTSDSDALNQVGWVMNECINICMICYQQYDIVNRRRHHCRACGNIICSNCCKRSAYLEGCFHLDQQMICDNCEPLEVTIVNL